MISRPGAAELGADHPQFAGDQGVALNLLVAVGGGLGVFGRVEFVEAQQLGVAMEQDQELVLGEEGDELVAVVVEFSAARRGRWRARAGFARRSGRSCSRGRGGRGPGGCGRGGWVSSGSSVAPLMCAYVLMGVGGWEMGLGVSWLALVFGVGVFGVGGPCGPPSAAARRLPPRSGGRGERERGVWGTSRV